MINVEAACQLGSNFTQCLADVKSQAGPGFTEAGFLGQIVGTLLPVILGLAGFITIIIIIISGIQLATSGGNPEAAGAGRGRLINALIGLALIILSFAITQIVDTLFLGNSGII